MNHYNKKLLLGSKSWKHFIILLVVKVCLRVSDLFYGQILLWADSFMGSFCTHLKVFFVKCIVMKCITP